jgi:acylphosphatase
MCSICLCGKKNKPHRHIGHIEIQMKISHINIHVSGKVQGVFYRASTKEKADELGVKGFVRNEPNGDVYIEAEGNEKQLEEFISWCRKGPTHARVTDVKINPSAAKDFKTFEISR